MHGFNHVRTRAATIVRLAGPQLSAGKISAQAVSESPGRVITRSTEPPYPIQRCFESVARTTSLNANTTECLIMVIGEPRELMNGSSVKTRCCERAVLA